MNGNGHDIFKEARCPVLSCEANRGDRGCYCGFVPYGFPCDHPRFRDQWRERTGYREPDLAGDNGHDPDPDPVPVPVRSLTARVSAAQRAADPLTPERARQMVMSLEAER